MTLRPLSGADVERLAEAVQHPSIRRWWGFTADGDSLRDGFWNDGTGFAIDSGGELAGWLGFNEEDDPDYRHAALDITLLPPFQGHGLGPEALRTVIRWLIEERGHHRFTIDPSVENTRAIRAYEAIGFGRVGVMRRYERGPDGRWRDGLLMERIVE